MKLNKILMIPTAALLATLSLWNYTETDVDQKETSIKFLHLLVLKYL